MGDGPEGHGRRGLRPTIKFGLVLENQIPRKKWLKTKKRMHFRNLASKI
jgi:hypothetical protein